MWYWLADCYRNWGKYQQAVDCQLKDLAIRQQLDDQTGIGNAYYQLDRIYQDWVDTPRPKGAGILGSTRQLAQPGRSQEE
ncbi:hypothetical protein [Moorena bouillonii]|uniref:hypothetical protein n=1 Tax=Moorena bouillonii TaxID=207920 RepID=UPI001E5925F9|nr:hypothetical protein [Moorena bouillonii]